MITIGLTGGIGTGKSLVSEILETLGGQLVNADLLGHQAYLPGTAGFDPVRDCAGEVAAPGCGNGSDPGQHRAGAGGTVMFSIFPVFGAPPRAQQ